MFSVVSMIIWIEWLILGFLLGNLYQISFGPLAQINTKLRSLLIKVLNDHYGSDGQ